MEHLTTYRTRGWPVTTTPPTPARPRRPLRTRLAALVPGPARPGRDRATTCRPGEEALPCV
jgi:hypothetical protein